MQDGDVFILFKYNTCHTNLNTSSATYNWQSFPYTSEMKYSLQYMVYNYTLPNLIRSFLESWYFWVIWNKSIPHLICYSLISGRHLDPYRFTWMAQILKNRGQNIWYIYLHFAISQIHPYIYSPLVHPCILNQGTQRCKWCHLCNS